ncbi:helix-turn-helix domain-containing protein [Maribellus maritimus]|uniref:helix-turn-helix domain-containing protein n=1 Tax=Maribellus maritimus TaxID=2870838 RepID=UPI001EEB4576|nr:AraC family transcriptional regulator [Maribellus maritimus]MCG6188500.1 AraC family transcriptional regulator [Maribellus maritimus]
MKEEIKSCHLGPEISPEQFIPEHIFLYLAKGLMYGYDGSKKYTLKPDEYCLLRKNRLARYNKQKENGDYEKVAVIFDEVFLRKFQQKHKISATKSPLAETFIPIEKNKLIPDFVRSLKPYYKGEGKIDKIFADVKREELLIIILQSQPELAGVFFDFGIPEKINLEEFMNRNYKFNVGIERFAFMTGRSLSAFKRDFKYIFNDSPSHWLVQKRLQEAYFLIEEKNRKPSEIYIELGFENLSHFSFAFKKSFGQTPGELTGKKRNSTAKN